MIVFSCAPSAVWLIPTISTLVINRVNKTALEFTKFDRLSQSNKSILELYSNYLEFEKVICSIGLYKIEF